MKKDEISSIIHNKLETNLYKPNTKINPNIQLKKDFSNQDDIIKKKFYNDPNIFEFKEKLKVLYNENNKTIKKDKFINHLNTFSNVKSSEKSMINSDSMAYMSLKNQSLRDKIETFDKGYLLSSKGQTKYIDDNLKDFYETNGINYTTRKSKIEKMDAIMNKSIFSKKSKKDIENQQDLIYFKNPYSSQQIIDINQQIFQKSMSHMIKNQIESYDKSYLDTNKILKSIEGMKNVKVILSLNKVKIQETNLQKIENQFKDNIEPTEDLYKRKKKFQYNYVEMKAQFIENYKYRPSSRSEFTMTLFNDYIYIIGGYNKERLIEIIVIDLKNNFEFINMNAEGETINPRMGHTTVRYKGHMYIFGGNFNRILSMPIEDIALYSISKFDFLF